MTSPNIKFLDRERLVHMAAPDLPDAYFDFSLFAMRLPDGFSGDNTASFRLNALPSLRVRQQVAHECCHVLQALQYPYFGNFTNYLWRRAEAIYDAVRTAPDEISFRLGEGLETFSMRTGDAGRQIWSSAIIQNRYDALQLREFHDQKPASLVSLTEAMAVSFQAVSTNALPEQAFIQLPVVYTRTHDFIASHNGHSLDLIDHHIFVAAIDPVLRATDFGDQNRFKQITELAKLWPKLRQTYLHMAEHPSASKEDYSDFILDVFDDYDMPRWDSKKAARHIEALIHAEAAVAAAAVAVASCVNHDILLGRNRTPNRVRYTPLSDAVAKAVEGTGWGDVAELNVPLALCSAAMRDQKFGKILAATLDCTTSSADIARLGDFALRTLEATPYAAAQDWFLNCVDHGPEDWNDALKCNSSQGISRSLQRLDLPPGEKVFQR
ncbi:hypothetical protein [Nioella sp. MMSF_3534]|uniref:hypothetical protein n=1 Tax=Nioella sp. MMSF_3534 TaxID=3046720 RepID=UPI00273ED4BE|nr:hypothetical protein [Nioella sp. MMSF_3534]